MTDAGYFVLGYIQLIEAVPQNRKQFALQLSKYGPVPLHSIHICCGNAALQVCLDALQVFTDTGVNITGDIQVIAVLAGDLAHGHKAGIVRIISDLLVESGNDFIDIPPLNASQLAHRELYNSLFLTAISLSPIEIATTLYTNHNKRCVRYFVLYFRPN